LIITASKIKIEKERNMKGLSNVKVCIIKENNVSDGTDKFVASLAYIQYLFAERKRESDLNLHTKMEK
jgi:hypothetical protein